MLKRLFHCIIAILVGLTSMLTSCSDKDYYDPDFVDGAVGEKPSTITFQTTKEVRMYFNYKVADGFASKFELYDTNPYVKESGSGRWYKDKSIKPISSGTHIQGSSNVVRTIPAKATTLYAYSSSLFVPTLMVATVRNSEATFEVFNVNDPIESASSRAGTRTVATQSVDHYLFQGAPIISKRATIPVEVLTQIANTFPEDVTVTDLNYYQDASLELKRDDSGDGIEVFLSVINSASGFNNSLSYFCYDGPKSDLPTLSNAQKQNLTIISAFQYAKLTDDGLKAGDYIKLKYWNGSELVDKFPTGVTVGWVLGANSFMQEWNYETNSHNYLVRPDSEPYPWFYSVAQWNPETKINPSTTVNKHTIRFSVEDKSGVNYICFGFEDLNREKSQLAWWDSDGDCNDVMFHVITNPVNALDPPPSITIEDVKSDDNRKGIVAFEDNWPKRDDYDMNDVVVRYNSDVTYIQKTENGVIAGNQFVSALKDEYELIHTGADYHNSFSIQYQIPYEDVESLNIQVVGKSQEEPTIYQDGDGFVLHLCERVSNVIDKYVTAPTPQKYIVNIKFKEGAVIANEFDSNRFMHAPYNIYISPSPHIQVHLPDYPPVWDEEMNTNGIALFGTGTDRSRVKDSSDNWQWTGRWYISGEKNYYPYAIHLAGETVYTLPKEKTAIGFAYPDYIKWVESGCLDYTDWYKYPGTQVQH